MKFGYTILYVSDVENAVAFYESAFGLRRTFVHESGYGEMATGETRLAFASVELAKSNGVSFQQALLHGPSPAVEIALVTDDVLIAFEKAVDAGATPIAVPKQKPWGQTVAYVRDINGFLVELCSPMVASPKPYSIRPIAPADTPSLVALSASSGLFKTEELGAIREMLDDYHGKNVSNGHQILTCDEGGTLLGIAYYCPKEFTDRVWELLMIAVDAARHRQGLGSAMLLAVEEAIKAAKGRLLLIETSDKSSFERTRQFYRKHGYSEVSRIPDYFTDGDGKASFVKRMEQ
jgi:ribosomal protein S18 acetylase RimI-like enzyme/uncharacterized glyoxalase superfamily protein PhnB